MGTDLKPTTAPLATALDGTELIPCAQGGASKALTPAQVKTYSGATAGPGSATDKALVRFSGTTGKLVQNGTLLESDAGVLQFGGTSSAQPALKNDSGAIGVRTADDSAYAPVVASLFACVGSGYKSKLDDSAGGIVIASNGSLIGANVTSLGGITSGDVAMLRDSAGAWRDTNGSSGIGARYCSRPVEANTAGVGSPNLLLTTESRKLLTNEGAAAENYHTLPSAAAGMEFQFFCQDADGIRIVANTGDTIRIEASVSAAAGFIRSTVIGSGITLVAINATEWVAVNKPAGTWTVDV
jgi:hypothetical protein